VAVVSLSSDRALSRYVASAPGMASADETESMRDLTSSVLASILCSLKMTLSAAMAACFFSSRVGSLGLDCACRCTESLARCCEEVEM
jgi:hypothetical protein